MKTLHRSFTHQILSWPSAAAHREPTAGRQEQPAPSSPPQAPTRRKQKRPAPSSLHQEPTTSKQEQLAPSSPLQAPIRRKREKKTVFISYCHEDKRFLEELLPHLDIYEQQGLIGVWSDRNIEVGAGWRKEIEEALEAAEVAILMISKYFLASKFIKKVELPHLLEAAKQRGLVIIPVILSPCVFGDSQLHQFQTINSPDRPVSKIRHKLDQDELWVKVAKKVKEVSG